MNEFVALDIRYFVAICVAIGVLITLEGLRQLLWSPDAGSKVRSKRLQSLTSNSSIEQVLGRLRVPVERSPLEAIPYFGDIPRRMRQAGMTLSARMLLMTSALATSVLFLLLQHYVDAFTAAGASILIGMFLPMSIINIFRKKRIDEFSKGLPDALDLMRRGLSVGHPLNVTIRNVASNMSDPIAGEFALVSAQIAYGETLPDAVMEMARRMDQEDAYYLAAAIQIQHGSGGNLGNILGTLSQVVRKRYAMRRRIKAVSSEGRISAMILSALPFGMYLGTLLTAPDYYSSVSDDPLFLPMCIGIAFFVIGNGMMLHKLVTFRF